MREGFAISGKALVLGALALIVAVVIGAMWVFGFGFFQRATAEFRGKTEQIEQTKGNGSYRIAAYDQFYNLCASIQTTEAAIVIFRRELKERGLSESRRQQVQTNLDANELNRADSINQYNADARKADTRGHFRASDLPYQIDPKVRKTTCTAP